MTSNYLAVICIYNFLKFSFSVFVNSLYTKGNSPSTQDAYFSVSGQPNIYNLLVFPGELCIHVLFICDLNIISYKYFTMPFVVVCSVWYLNYTFCFFMNIEVSAFIDNYFAFVISSFVSLLRKMVQKAVHLFFKFLICFPIIFYIRNLF